MLAVEDGFEVGDTVVGSIGGESGGGGRGGENARRRWARWRWRDHGENLCGCEGTQAEAEGQADHEWGGCEGMTHVGSDVGKREEMMAG